MVICFNHIHMNSSYIYLAFSYERLETFTYLFHIYMFTSHWRKRYIHISYFLSCMLYEYLYTIYIYLLFVSLFSAVSHTSLFSLTTNIHYFQNIWCNDEENIEDIKIERDIRQTFIHRQRHYINIFSWA